MREDSLRERSPACMRERRDMHLAPPLMVCPYGPYHGIVGEWLRGRIYYSYVMPQASPGAAGSTDQHIRKGSVFCEREAVCTARPIRMNSQCPAGRSRTVEGYEHPHTDSSPLSTPTMTVACGQHLLGRRRSHNGDGEPTVHDAGELVAAACAVDGVGAGQQHAGSLDRRQRRELPRRRRASGRRRGGILRACIPGLAIWGRVGGCSSGESEDQLGLALGLGRKSKIRDADGSTVRCVQGPSPYCRPPIFDCGPGTSPSCASKADVLRRRTP